MQQTTSPLQQASIQQDMQEHLRLTADLIQRIDVAAVSRLVDKLFDCYRQGARVFIFGNGGSAATASHLCEDLAKSTVKDASVDKRLRVISLTDSVPFITALGNDWGFECVFREQLRTLASPGDVAIAISGSGNSPNIICAVEWARDHGLYTVGFSGFSGGALRTLVDLSVHCPVMNMEIAENAHMVVAHLAVGGLRSRMSGEA